MLKLLRLKPTTLWPDFQKETVMNWGPGGRPSGSMLCVARLIDVKFAFLGNNSPLSGWSRQTSVSCYQRKCKENLCSSRIPTRYFSFRRGKVRKLLGPSGCQPLGSRKLPGSHGPTGGTFTRCHPSELGDKCNTNMMTRDWTLQVEMSKKKKMRIWGDIIYGSRGRNKCEP